MPKSLRSQPGQNADQVFEVAQEEPVNDVQFGSFR